jgi:hypothetical protein
MNGAIPQPAQGPAFQHAAGAGAGRPRNSGGIPAPTFSDESDGLDSGSNSDASSSDLVHELHSFGLSGPRGGRPEGQAEDMTHVFASGFTLNPTSAPQPQHSASQTEQAAQARVCGGAQRDPLGPLPQSAYVPRQAQVPGPGPLPRPGAFPKQAPQPSASQWNAQPAPDAGPFMGSTQSAGVPAQAGGGRSEPRDNPYTSGSPFTSDDEDDAGEDVAFEFGRAATLRSRGSGEGLVTKSFAAMMERLQLRVPSEAEPTPAVPQPQAGAGDAQRPAQTTSWDGQPSRQGPAQPTLWRAASQPQAGPEAAHGPAKAMSWDGQPSRQGPAQPTLWREGLPSQGLADPFSFHRQASGPMPGQAAHVQPPPSISQPQASFGFGAEQGFPGQPRGGNQNGGMGNAQAAGVNQSGPGGSAGVPAPQMNPRIGVFASASSQRPRPESFGPYRERTQAPTHERPDAHHFPPGVPLRTWSDGLDTEMRTNAEIDPAVLEELRRKLQVGRDGARRAEPSRAQSSTLNPMPGVFHAHWLPPGGMDSMHEGASAHYHASMTGGSSAAFPQPPSGPRDSKMGAKPVPKSPKRGHADSCNLFSQTAESAAAPSAAPQAKKGPASAGWGDALPRVSNPPQGTTQSAWASHWPPAPAPAPAPETTQQAGSPQAASGGPAAPKFAARMKPRAAALKKPAAKFAGLPRAQAPPSFIFGPNSAPGGNVAAGGPPTAQPTGGTSAPQQPVNPKVFSEQKQFWPPGSEPQPRPEGPPSPFPRPPVPEAPQAAPPSPGQAFNQGYMSHNPAQPPLRQSSNQTHSFGADRVVPQQPPVFNSKQAAPSPTVGAAGVGQENRGPAIPANAFPPRAAFPTATPVPQPTSSGSGNAAPPLFKSGVSGVPPLFKSGASGPAAPSEGPRSGANANGHAYGGPSKAAPLDRQRSAPSPQAAPAPVSFTYAGAQGMPRRSSSSMSLDTQGTASGGQGPGHGPGANGASVDKVPPGSDL